MFSNSMYMRNLRSFVRRSAGPLLGLWLIACVLERLVMEFIFRSRGEDALGIWQLLTSMQTDALDQRSFLLLLFVATGISAFRTALYKPALDLMRGRGGQSAGEMFVLALERIPRVLSWFVIKVFILIAIVVLCTLVNSPIFFFVEFPISVALSPVVYLVVARDYSIKRAFHSALRMWRRRWMLMFVVQCSLTLLGLTVSQLRADAPEHLGLALMFFIGVQYARWVGEMALFLTLDPRRKSE